MVQPAYKLPVPPLEYIPWSYIQETHAALKPHVVRTPVISSDFLSAKVSKAVGHQVKLYFKAELLQKTGAFKFRGALNAVRSAKEARAHGSLPGIVTHSSGNHGAALACAAQLSGINVTVVVPSFATPTKLANVRRYGAEVIKVEPRHSAMREACERIVAERDYTLVTSYNQRDIIAGQATCAVEFVEDVPQIEALLAPVSGGGLISGLALACKHMKPSIKVFGVAPVVKKLGQALESQSMLDHWSPQAQLDSQLDALRSHPGDITFPLLCELLEKQAFDVSDAEAAAAMKVAWQQLKLTVELSSSIVIAALDTTDFIRVVKEQNLRHIGLVLSGGNADLDGPLPWTSLH